LIAASVALLGIVSLLVSAPAKAGGLSILTQFVQTATMMGTQSGYLAASSSARQMYEQTVIAPPMQLQSVTGSLNSLNGMYAPLMSSFNSLSVRSAGTSQTQAMETSMYGGSSSSIHSQYSSVYGALPPSSAVTPQIANQIDMQDAVAKDALALASTSDTTQATLTADAKVELQSASNTAPGTSDMLTAQSAALQLQSQAIQHHLLAALLRERAIEVATKMAQIKHGVGTQIPAGSN
jgi:hypothetical protein